MSLQHAAQHLAAQGRGPDRTLVHMSPREVAGLQAIAKAHGGSLTVNPKTGLVEAGFLDSLMPTLLGIGLTALTGGAAAPWMIGAGIGGLQTLRTGSLKEGLLAGMGAYGGAGLASGVASMGAQAGTNAAATEAAAAGEAAATSAGEQAAQQQAANAAMEQAGNQSAAESARLAATAPPTVGQEAMEQSAREYASNAAGNTNELARGINAGVQPANTGFSAATQQVMANPMQAGLQAAANNPSAYVDQMGGGASLAKTGLTALSPAITGAMTPKTPPVPGEEKYTGPLSKYSMSANYQPYEQQQPNPYYQAQYRDYRYAGGGPVEQMSNANAIGENTGFPMANLHQGAYATPWQTPVSQNVVEGTADTGVDRMTGEENRFAAGGVSNLGGYSDGGRMLKGPGDGMSDSIPAQIGGKQPARLADGEFVVPADVVSHLGNGSTDAGAKQLYKMMDRIRQQRTGKKKQAPEVNPGKAMPA